ncbi:phosphonate C-P lyase system protein PhnG [Halomonas sp. RA08-2]|uniref:phosphonate C-P lyase system protein PhnG n=1 Tax=Halomonas sp. RA08-2 TaxID=3440842 RepID=UPI003EED084E
MTDARRRQRILALSPGDRVEQAWNRLGIAPPYRCVRGPETGMAMVRGRMGGTGNVFNLGEMTLTRVSVALEDGTLGHGWVKGRDHRHAKLIALTDACARRPEWEASMEEGLIAPLEALLVEEHETQAKVAAATRVDFFTMVRGE